MSSPTKVLYKCEPVDWLWLPRPIRISLAYITTTLFSLTFFSIPFSACFLLPMTWRKFPILSTIYVGSLILSMLLPLKEWPFFRKLGQLWYELFDFRCNLSKEAIDRIIIEGSTHQFIVAMHPHGIIPLQAVLWAGYCDQYLRNENGAMYGFGAAADAVEYIPFLRNIMGWLTAGSAAYKVLKDGLTKVN